MAGFQGIISRRGESLPCDTRVVANQPIIAAKEVPYSSPASRTEVVHRLKSRRVADQRGGDVPRPFENAARDLADRFFRIAWGLQRARRAIELAGAVEALVVIDDRSGHDQPLACGTGIDVPGLVEPEVGSGELPSSRLDLSKTGMCGAIPLVSTSQCSEGADL